MIDMLRTLAIRRLYECAEDNAGAVSDWLIRNQIEEGGNYKKYPEQRSGKSGYTTKQISEAAARSRSYEREFFSETGPRL